MKKAPTRLRSEAEARLALVTPTVLSAYDAEKLLHELQTHQIELEMQNAALRQFQQELEKSRDRYASLYEFAPVGYLSLSKNGLVTESNLAAAELLRQGRKRLRNRRFGLFVVAEDRDRWERQFQIAVRNGGKQTCELTFKRGDGTAVDVSLDYLLMESGDARPTLRVALTDITQRKRYEEELRILAIAFEGKEGVMITDSQAVILRINRAFTELTGFTEEDAIGKTPVSLHSGTQDKFFYQDVWKIVLGHGHWQGELWNRHKDGQLYAEWLTISAVKASDGTVTHYVGAFSDITRNKEAEAEIHRLAYYDPLTKLPNRRLLHDRIGQALVASNRSGGCGALLFLDLDHFKTLNDTRGHAVGDKLLIEVAGRLKASIRENDTVARLGGDEFLVVLNGLSVEHLEAAIDVRQIGEKIRTIIGQPYELDDRGYHCCVSIGATLFHGTEQPADVLLQQADLAMYKAKEGGRNLVCFFDPAMQLALDAYTALEGDLRLALPRGQLRLFYQPQLDESGHVVGAEALLRWDHPVRGMVPPADFIPLAEETGLILPIGRWVLETACTQLKAWSASPETRELQLAINVSARQFRQPEFVALVSGALSEAGVSPTRLKIELTESLVINDVPDTIASMTLLKTLGVRLSIDDFGTGFSSLSYLSSLPLDELKIDQSFVRNMTAKAQDAAIVQTIITIGNTLGLTVIAEGVETEFQRACLGKYGCALYQGFLFSRPLPLASFEEFLARDASHPAMATM